MQLVAYKLHIIRDSVCGGIDLQTDFWSTVVQDKCKHQFMVCACVCVCVLWRDSFEINSARARVLLSQVLLWEKGRKSTSHSSSSMWKKSVGKPDLFNYGNWIRALRHSQVAFECLTFAASYIGLTQRSFTALRAETLAEKLLQNTSSQIENSLHKTENVCGDWTTKVNSFSRCIQKELVSICRIGECPTLAISSAFKSMRLQRTRVSSKGNKLYSSLYWSASHTDSGITRSCSTGGTQNVSD